MGEIRYEVLYDIFKLFLERHECYDAFVANMRCVSLYQHVTKYKCEPYGLVQYGFKWTMSKEGFAYWSDVDSKWRNVLNSLIG